MLLVRLEPSMQISPSASLSIGPNRPLQRPVPQTLAKPPETGGVTPPNATGGPAQQPIDIAKILQHWGTSNVEADLNVDGIVDAQDLALASAQQNAGSTAVQGSWGQSGVNDANGDGVVDATDLAHALHAQTVPPAGDPANDRTQIVSAVIDVAMQARDNDGDGEILASDFKDNGRIFRQLDLDESGSVGREELEKALNAHFARYTEANPNANPQSFASRWIEAFLGKRPAPDLTGMDRVAQLFQQGAGGLTGRGGISNILSARA
jgi:hypothetical protein